VPARRIHVHRAPEQRPALEPWIALVAAFRGDRRNAQARLQHLHHGFNLHHGRSDFDGRALVVQQLPRQFGVKLGQREDSLF
jgi:hypothetical protein